jgi:hypothetical protein
VQDTTGVAVNRNPSSQENPSVANGGAGKLLIVSQGFQAGAVRIVGNFFWPASNATAVFDERVGAPKESSLYQNYPNPFNPSTTIRYVVSDKSTVLLTVFNALGQQVALLQNGEQDAGFHEVQFDGSRLSSGVYFYRMTAGGFIQTRKLLLMK